ncbi:ABC transporter substrate-binding protein [Dendronalium sp. ChiSLP03b]|uniref:TRAP transporter substrate-binding protein n=1 Tax=Dendronalium sp. ChiSLP03b TaxID=3075381 RepID=UPI002AD3F403|nr:ABC transporter substrate-binding protein [Dendronalium sp. ChiSLP03b]MDZ8205295.1 ABC transporter substrate-binding protein [Dendronalium sp. ChiSLP03b]
MLGELVEVVTKLSEVSDRLKQAGKGRHQEIAEYFTKIEVCLQDSAEQLKSGTVPNNKWGELEIYAYDLRDTIGKEIGDAKAKELGRLLMKTACNIPTDKDIQSIENAAGKFRGLANTITIKKDSNSTTRRQIFTYPAIGLVGLAGGFSLHWYLSQAGKSANGEPSKATDQFPDIKHWRMPTFLSDSVRHTILWNAPDRVCNRIKDMTGGHFDITPDRNRETLEILTKVNNGEKGYECGYSGIYYGRSYKALYFGSAIPFGLNPQEQNAWLYYKKNPDDEETYVQSIYKTVGLENIISFPAGATGAQMGGWFNKKITSVNDFKNLTIRIPGLGGDVLKGFGLNVTTHLDLEEAGKGKYPIDECIKLLKQNKSGTVKNRFDAFDAVEWTGPHDDIELGLHQAANFYYYPGWWEPGTTFDVQVNRKAWDELPRHYQEIFKVACFETHMEMLAEYNQKNIKALKNFPPNIERIEFSNEIMEAAEDKTKEVLNQLAKNPIFNKVYQDWQDFKEEIAWINKVSSI